MHSVKTGAAVAVATTIAFVPLVVAAPASAATAEPTQVTAANSANTLAGALAINEVQSSAPATQMGGQDWLELINTSPDPLDVSGVIVSDADQDHAYVLAPGTEIAAGDYLVLTADDFQFGLGKGDSIRLFAPNTTVTDGVIDEAAQPFATTTWPAGQHTSPSWGRCPDGTGDFGATTVATPGAANICETIEEPGVTPEPEAEPAEYSGDLTINEVESNGDDTDWVEIANLTDNAIDISGWSIKDDDDARTDVVPAGSVVPANGMLVVDQETATYPEGFTFGLGNGDAFRLYDLEGTLQAKTTWPGHALVTWARCPDGTGDWRDSTTATKGAPNDCSVPLRLNEVNSSGTDFAEIINIGASEIDASGLVIKDSDDSHVYTVPAGTTIAAGATLTVDDLGFGLGGEDSVRLFATDEETVIDSYSWTAHGTPSWGRCPDGTGDWATTASATPGELNDCDGYVRATAWPGGSDVTVVDGEEWFTSDMSGIDYDPATGALWAVQNGDGLLYKLVADADGGWRLAPGYENGRVLGYPGGESGVVDAEGVTVRDGEPGVVYVSSERNNAASGVSRPSVLRYEVNGTGALTATTEWNLSSIPALAALPANGGLEGITWIPAVDAFAVGVEGTAAVYLVRLGADGSVTLLDSLSTEAAGFSLVADVQWDSERDQLWVVCDEACDGRIATFARTEGAWRMTALYERPVGMGNVANEGFAIAPSSTAVNGSVATFYMDDADTDGFSLRSGTLPAVDDTAGGDGTGDGSGGSNGSGDGSSGSDNGGDTAGPDATVNLDCSVTAPASATPGETITITIDRECAGSEVTEVTVWMYSKPTLVGTAGVAADGSIQVKVPESIPAGAHTIEVQLADGTIVGSVGIQVSEAPAAALADTGARDLTGALTWVALLITLGAAVALGARRTLGQPR